MKKLNKWLVPYANDNDPLIPELWAQESLMILENSMVAGNLVHRDFENEISRFGDVVNTRKPAGFTAVRKVDTDDVTVQDATVTNVPVPLDQYWHTSFMIYDGEESKSFKDLVATHLFPAVSSVAQAIDEVVNGQVYRFLANHAGKTRTTPTDATIIAAREVLTTNKCPLAGRFGLITPNVEGAFLGISNFVQASSVGDAGSAMREGHVGKKYGIDFFTTQNAPSVAAPTGAAAVYGAVNLSAGYAAGTATMTVDGLSAAVVAGTYFTVAGDMYPQQVVSSTGGSTPTEIVFTPGLKYAVANDAVITLYAPGAINLSAGYTAPWSKAMTVSGFGSVAPKRGQMVKTAAGAIYSTIGVPTATSLVFDRPLSATLANSTVLNLGPAGDYCFVGHRNAIALVTRPLATPKSGTGALSYVANYNGLSLRVTITYNGVKQGHLVTIDMLGGVQVLDTALGCVMMA
jgi:hypothetical protein